MSFYAASNIAEQSVAVVAPWDFVPAQKISAQVRGSKQDRQEWYRNIDTVHQFYTGLEGMNYNMRVSKENPPLRLHGIVADYDVPLEDERIDVAIAGMTHKPAWVERSLGGNARLIWTLESPLVVSDAKFYTAVARELIEHLNLKTMAGLDEGAFLDATRLYANGCAWRKTGHGPVDVQAVFVKASRTHRFVGVGKATIPLDVVLQAIKAKWPDFTWPTDFVPGSQGPSWWIPESVSPLSAIVKAEGMITFSAHAMKVFYSWADILGSDFVQQFKDDSIAKATKDIFYDGKSFWRKLHGYYKSCDKFDVLLYWEVTCGISNKAEKDGGPSPLKLALEYVMNQHRVDFAAPFAMQAPGLMISGHSRRLNTYPGKPLDPAAGTQKWGGFGNFPMISEWQSTLFDPIQEQLLHNQYWFQYFYQAALDSQPHPGQNNVLAGISGIGKTAYARLLIGPAVGGFSDASSYLVEGGTFNAHLLDSPLWCLDDDTPTSSGSLRKFHAAFKKVASNIELNYNQKFEKMGMTEWPGRIILTTNLDPVSLKVIGPVDDGTKAKVNIYRCASRQEFVFPSRSETRRLFREELPYYLRYIIDLKWGDEFDRCSRYGIASYQNQDLLNQTYQISSSAPFKEVLIKALTAWFKAHPTALEWSGTISELVDMIALSIVSEAALKAIRLDNANRHMESIKREGLLKCESETGAMKVRIWKIKRFIP